MIKKWGLFHTASRSSSKKQPSMNPSEKYSCMTDGGLRTQNAVIPRGVVRSKYVTIENNKSAKVHFKLKFVKQSDCKTALDIE
jgi:hypothetical protein